MDGVKEPRIKRIKVWATPWGECTHNKPQTKYLREKFCHEAFLVFVPHSRKTAESRGQLQVNA